MAPKKKRAKSKIKDNNIRTLLEDLKMSQQELADLCDTNRAHINKLVNNRCNCISLPIAMKIAKNLNQPVEKVFTLQDK